MEKVIIYGGSIIYGLVWDKDPLFSSSFYLMFLGDLSKFLL
jgi:hypothetical protein